MIATRSTVFPVFLLIGLAVGFVGAPVSAQNAMDSGIHADSSLRMYAVFPDSQEVSLGRVEDWDLLPTRCAYSDPFWERVEFFELINRPLGFRIDENGKVILRERMRPPNWFREPAPMDTIPPGVQPE